MSAMPKSTETEPDDELALWCLINRQAAPVRPAQDPMDTLRCYPFTWGRIVERLLSNGLMVWDFELSVLHTRYRVAGLEYESLQVFVFRLLMTLSEYCCDSLVNALHELNVQPGWRIVPGPAGGSGPAFSVVCHFTQQSQSRSWMAAELVGEILPLVVNHSVQYVRARDPGEV